VGSFGSKAKICRKCLKKGNFPLFQAMVTRHKEVLEHKTRNGESLLFSSAKIGRLEFVEFLLSHTYVGSQVIDGVDKKNRTPIWIATANYCKAIRRQNSTSKELFYSIIERLVKSGANLDIADSKWNLTPLELSIKIQDGTLIQLFLDHGATSLSNGLSPSLNANGLGSEFQTRSMDSTEYYRELTVAS